MIEVTVILNSLAMIVLGAFMVSENILLGLAGFMFGMAAILILISVYSLGNPGSFWTKVRK